MSDLVKLLIADLRDHAAASRAAAGLPSTGFKKMADDFDGAADAIECINSRVRELEEAIDAFKVADNDGTGERTTVIDAKRHLFKVRSVLKRERG